MLRRSGVQFLSETSLRTDSFVGHRATFASLEIPTGKLVCKVVRGSYFSVLCSWQQKISFFLTFYKIKVALGNTWLNWLDFNDRNLKSSQSNPSFHNPFKCYQMVSQPGAPPSPGLSAQYLWSVFCPTLFLVLLMNERKMCLAAFLSTLNSSVSHYLPTKQWCWQVKW